MVDKIEKAGKIIGLIAAIAGIFLTIYTLYMDYRVHSGEFVLQLDQRVYADKYDAIFDVIEKASSTPVSQFGEKKIDYILSELETVGNLYQSGLIEKRMAYDMFSYDFEKAYCNMDIRSYIEKERKDDKSPIKFFEGFEALAKIFMRMDNYTCADVNNI